MRPPPLAAPTVHEIAHRPQRYPPAKAPAGPFALELASDGTTLMLSAEYPSSLLEFLFRLARAITPTADLDSVEANHADLIDGMSLTQEARDRWIATLPAASLG